MGGTSGLTRTHLVGAGGVILLAVLVVTSWMLVDEDDDDDGAGSGSDDRVSQSPIEPEQPRLTVGSDLSDGNIVGWWLDDELAMRVEEFGTVEVPVEFEVPSDFDGSVWLEIDGGAAGWVGPNRWELGLLSPGPQAVVLSANAPSELEVGGSVAGSVLLTDGSEPVTAPLVLSVEVVERDPAAARSELLVPSGDRLVETSAGSLVADQLTVFIDDGADVAAAVADEHGMRVIGASEIAGVYQFLVDFGADTREEVADDSRVMLLQQLGVELSADDRVRHASPSMMQRMPRSAAAPGTASRAAPSWHLDAAGVPGVRERWAEELGGWGQVHVAVLDVDFDLRHTHVPFAEMVGTARVFGGDGHGTMVSGIVCGDRNDNQGTAGVSEHCDLRAHNVGARTMSFDERCGEQERPACFSVKIPGEMAIEQMVIAAADGARVVNMSFGPELDSAACAEAAAGSGVTYQLLLGEAQRFANTVVNAHRVSPHGSVLWVRAAGNDACSAEMVGADRLSHSVPVPGMHPDVAAEVASSWITVAATSHDGGLWYDAASGRGSNNHPDVISVAAPGHDIVSTDACSAIPVATVGAPLPTTCSRYDQSTGTSYAAPIVTGIAVTMFAANPDLTADQVKRCVVRTATTPIPDHPFKVVVADAAVACAVEPVWQPSIDDPPEVIFDRWMQAVVERDQFQGRALELPGRDPSVWNWATAEIGRHEGRWQGEPRCGVTDRQGVEYASCYYGELSDPEPWMVLLRDESGRWKLSHFVGIWWGEPSEWYVFCIEPDVELRVRGADDLSYPGVEVDADRCGWVGGPDIGSVPDPDAEQWWTVFNDQVEVYPPGAVFIPESFVRQDAVPAFCPEPEQVLGLPAVRRFDIIVETVECFEDEAVAEGYFPAENPLFQDPHFIGLSYRNGGWTVTWQGQRPPE